MSTLHAALAAAHMPAPPANLRPVSGGFIRYGKNNRYWLKEQDGVALFGDWATGESHHWFAKSDKPMDAQAIAARKAKLAEMRQQQAREQAQVHEERATLAAERWASMPEMGTSPYLARKQVEAFGMRYQGATVVVPLRDGMGKLWSLQYIQPTGEKRFLSGGKKRGCFHTIGPIGEAVIVAEGYATAASIHMATGLPVVVAFDAGNLDPVVEALRNQCPTLRITIAADNDCWKPESGNPGKEAAEAVAAKHGCTVVLPQFTDAAKASQPTDFNDLHVLEGLEAVRAQLEHGMTGDLLQPAAEDKLQPEANAGAPDEEEPRERQSQASALVLYIQERCELFHDQNQEVYAKDLATHETRRIESRAFKDWLVSGFFEQTRKSARDQSVREAIATLSGLGRYTGECRDVSVRVAAHTTGYYLDLGQKGNSRAVRIYPGGWECTDCPPVCFVRPETLRPLSEPVHGGDVSPLWDLVNIPVNVRLLVIAWLCECLRPDTPFPVLELIGEQGSAKSTTQTALRRLIDANACDLRAIPKTVEDVYVSALVNWVTSYENVSHLSAPMQDALCIVATGGGHAKRKLYTDSDESVLNVKRPIVLNGISAAVTAQDLIDRALSVEVPRISERVETTNLWQHFEAKHSAMLGGLLDLMGEALARLPHIHLPKEDQPRLIEFVRFGMAIAEAMGKGGNAFLEQFTESRKESISRTIDSSPVASAVLEWFEKNPLGRTDTAKALMELVAHHKPSHTDAWPRTAKGFADALRRAAPALRQFGIECRSLGKVGGTIEWEIVPRRKSQNPSPECPASPEMSPETISSQDIRTCRTSFAEFSSVMTSPSRMVEVTL